MVEHKDLLSEPSKYLCNGALTVRVDFDFEVIRSQHHYTAQCARQAQLYESGDFFDFTLIASDGKRFRVHRSILAAHSSVFAGMLKHGTVEHQTGSADIVDVDGETLELLLKYVNSGSLTKVAEVAEKVLEAADKYELLDLRDLSVKLLCANLTAQNALRLLTIVDQRNLLEVKRVVTEFILGHVEIFRQTMIINS